MPSVSVSFDGVVGSNALYKRHRHFNRKFQSPLMESLAQIKIWENNLKGSKRFQSPLMESLAQIPKSADDCGFREVSVSFDGVVGSNMSAEELKKHGARVSVSFDGVVGSNI